MIYKDFNIKLLDYDYDTVYAFMSVASRLPDLPQDTEYPTNHIKFEVYARTFPCKPRTKYTGFEFATELDHKARQKIADSLSVSEITGTQDVTELERQTGQADLVEQEYQYNINLNKFENRYNIQSLSDAIDVYRNKLIENALKHQGQLNVLYFSGGADSEMTLWSFMEAGVDFVPVTFVYVNNQGDIINYHDTIWADEFCREHDLPQIKRELNVEEFWNSPELLEYAKIGRTSSPQIAAYHKMVDEVHSEISEHGFDRFAGRQITQTSKLILPGQSDYSMDNFTEVAPDIWSLKVFDSEQCQTIVDTISEAEFSLQQGDHLPVEELMIPEWDPVFYNALERYLGNTVEELYFNYYQNSYFDVLTAWFNRLGESVTDDQCETHSIRLHHDKSRISMGMVLNSDFEGGEIVFPRQNFDNSEIEPGTLLMWPGQITHPHAVRPVTRGTRYAMIVLTKLETFSTRSQQLRY